MKRLLMLLLCCCLLCPRLQAAEPEKWVALTFDDGPSGRFTCRLLEGLEARNVKATFLLCGYRMAQYPALTRRIHQAGHEIGLHGYSHDPMDQMSANQLRRELTDTLALLPAGCSAVFLRPPGGQSNAVTRTVARDMGLSLLHWSVDPKDWESHDVAAITQQVLCQVRDGDVILLHDMSDSSVDAALRIIDQLMDQNFRFVTVSQLATAKKICPAPGQVYRRFA